MRKMLVVAGLVLAASCQRPAPKPVPVVQVTPPTPEAVAEVPPPTPPEPPKPAEIPRTKSGTLLEAFLAPGPAGSPADPPATRPGDYARAPFDPPPSEVTVPTPPPRPLALPPLVTRRVGPRDTPEPAAPHAAPATDHALTPRQIEPWRLPPGADPLRPDLARPADRPESRPGVPEPTASDLRAWRVALAPLVPSFARPAPRPWPDRPQGAMGTRLIAPVETTADRQADVR